MTQSTDKKNGWGCLGIPLVIIVALGLGYFFGKRALVGQELTPLSGSKIIPPNATMTGFVSTNSDSWSKFNRFDTVSPRRIIEENWLDLSRELEQDNVDYQEDIESWLGGLMFAVLPNSEVNLSYDFVVIGGIKNKFKARDFFDKIKADSATELLETEHQNITIYQGVREDNTPIWFTFFDNYLVVSDQESPLRNIINTFKGGESIADVKQLSGVAKEKLNVDNPLFQVYLTDYDRILQNMIQDWDDFPISKEEITTINGAVMSLNIQDYGINLNTVADLTEPINQEEMKPSSNKLINEISDDALFMVDGIRINKLWQQVEKNRLLIPDLNDAIRELELLARGVLNLDLNKDVFGWLDGEFAFGISADDSSSFLDSGLRGLLVLETGDRPSGENTITKLETMANFLPFIQINNQEIGQINTKEWSSFNNPILSYGWLNDDSLLINFSANINSFDNTNINPLTNDSTFQLTTSNLPRNNFGHVYLDVEKTLNFALQKSPTLLDGLSLDEKKLIESIKGIAIATSSNNPNSSQIDINISLKKK